MRVYMDATRSLAATTRLMSGTFTVEDSGCGYAYDLLDALDEGEEATA